MSNSLEFAHAHPQELIQIVLNRQILRANLYRVEWASILRANLYRVEWALILRANLYRV